MISCLPLFLWMGAIFPFFHSEGNTQLRRACLKIVSNGTQIKSLRIFSMQMLILPFPWALFESRFRMIFPISLDANVTVDRRLSGIKEHCLKMKKLKSLAFSLKSVLKRFSLNSEGIIGTSLLFKKTTTTTTKKQKQKERKKVFNRDQYSL